MKQWTALRHQAAMDLLAELERLEPDNPVVIYSRTLFAVAAPNKPPTAAELNRVRQAEKKMARAAQDRQIAELYRSGLSMVEVGRRLSVPQSRVADALARTNEPTRPGGSPTGTSVDLARIDRIRKMRAQQPPATLEDIAAAERISRERVRQICAANDIDTRASDQLTPKQLEAVQNYLAGDSLAFTAAAYGVGAAALRNWILRAGHQPRSNGARHSPAVRLKAASAAELYKAGRPVRAIAEDLGLKKPEEVYRLLAIHGIRPNRGATTGFTQ